MDRSLQYRRLWFLTWGLFAGFAVVAVRLIQVQWLDPRDPDTDEPVVPTVAVRKPALRGTILDAQGIPLAQSWITVLVRADPVHLGSHAREVARLAAPFLKLSEIEVMERMRPVQFPVTNAIVVTNGLQVITNLQVQLKTRRSNLIATNVTLADWHELSALLRTNRFPGQIQLIEEREQLRERVRAERAGIPWWDLAGWWHSRRGALAAERQVTRRLRALQRELLPCRRNGLFSELVQVRTYPHDHLAAHVIGFTTNNFAPESRAKGLPVPLQGAQGLEQRCDRELRERPGLVRMRMLRGREYVPGRMEDIAAQDGSTVVLTLDIRIQEAVERALDDAVQRLNPSSMCAIVVRPSTGDILALANRPTFNLNDRRVETLEAFKNRALVDSYEPGSTFKVVTWSAVLNEGKASLEDWIDCHRGRWVVPKIGRQIQDDQGHQLGVVSVLNAFTESSNVGAVKLAMQLQPERFLQYVRDFGFLARTDIECAELSTNRIALPDGGERVRISIGESAGRLPSWDGLTASSLAFGCAIRGTPLQSLMAVSALANGGILMKPRLVQRIEESDGGRVLHCPPRQVRRVVSPETAAAMVRAMRAAVESGTGRPAALEDFDVAGKTGTAKLSLGGAYHKGDYYASFVGFLPAGSPEVAIIVTAERPTTAGKAYYGGKACAPVFREIALEVANVLQLAPTVVRSNTVTAGWNSPSLHGGGPL